MSLILWESRQMLSFSNKALLYTNYICWHKTYSCTERLIISLPYSLRQRKSAQNSTLFFFSCLFIMQAIWRYMYASCMYATIMVWLWSLYCVRIMAVITIASLMVLVLAAGVSFSKSNGKYFCFYVQLFTQKSKQVIYDWTDCIVYHLTVLPCL